MDAWLWLETSTGLLGLGVTLVVALVVARLRARRQQIVATPVIARATAFRERSRHAAYVPLRDPGRPGCRRRPRAPSSTPH
jgi:hypothetical protein